VSPILIVNLCVLSPILLVNLSVVSQILLVNLSVVSPTLDVNPTIFVIPCKKIGGMIDLIVASKFQSTMTTFHHIFVRMQIIPIFVSITACG
jgi:hypothetical protein